MSIRSLLRPLRNLHRRSTFGKAVRKVSQLRENEIPNRSILDELRYGWGNSGWPASADYLEEMCRLVFTTDGPILECGSGLTTLVLGLLKRRNAGDILSLEHKSEWRDHLSELMIKYRASNVNLVLSPLRDYGDFSWYDVSNVSIPDNIGLVICDGPPQSTPGGRYGLIPVIGSKMSRDCVVLLDDASREGEVQAMKKWESELSANIEISGESNPYAIITVP